MFTYRFAFAFAVIGGLHVIAIWAAWQSTTVTTTVSETPSPPPITIRIAPVVAVQAKEISRPAPQETPKKLVPTVKNTIKKPTPALGEQTSTASAFGTTEAVPTPAAPSDLTESESLPEPPPLYAADYVSNPAPEYPKLSRKYREEGVVDVRVLVNPDGSAEHVELAHSSGFSRLDKAALAAVKSWRFLPQRQDAALISSWIVVPVRFDLQKKESVRG